MSADRCWSIARGLAIGVALFAWFAHAKLATDETVPAWLLPMSLAACALFAKHEPAATTSPSTRPPRWLLAGTLITIATLTGVLAWGALATGDRDWDGVVAWGLKAKALSAQANITQPLFADPAVFHHSPDYPLLQPLAIAAVGRAWFPCVYALLVAITGLAVRRRTGDGALACWIALAVALTPDLIGTGGGAVDSGYADAAHALALAIAAAALLLDDAQLLGAAALLLPFVKPEGTVHAVALAGAALMFGKPRLGIAATIGAAAALALWLPLQMRLAHAPPPGLALPLGVLAAAAVAIAVRLALRGRSFAPRTLWLAGGAAAATGALLLVFAQPLFADSKTILLSHYLGDLGRLTQKLPQTPTILAGLAEAALSPRRCGALFALLAVLACTRSRTAPLAGPSLRPLTAFVLFAIAILTAAFFLSPEPDVAHHLRSSAPRLWLQLCGAGWLLAGGALAARLHDATLPRWLARALGREG